MGDASEYVRTLKVILVSLTQEFEEILDRKEKVQVALRILEEMAKDERSKRR